MNFPFEEQLPSDQEIHLVAKIMTEQPAWPAEEPYAGPNCLGAVLLCGIVIAVLGLIWEVACHS